MPNNNSLYGSVTNTGSVSSQNYTTLYSSSTAGVANGNLTVDGTLTVNGCAILTNCTSFDLLPTTATTINFGLAATALNLGAATGVTLINNQLATANYTFPVADGTNGQVLTTDGAGNVYWALPGGGGSTFGNITVGVVTDNTISTTTGDLDITSNTGMVNINRITLGAIGGDIVRPIGLGDTLSLKYQPFISPGDGWNATITESGPSVGGVTYYPLVAGVDFNTGSAVNNSGVGIKYATDLGSSSLTPIGSTEFIAVDIATNNYDFVVQKRNPSSLPWQLEEIFRVTNAGSATATRFDTYATTSSTAVGVGGRIAGNDYWNVGGYSVSGTAGNDGALEIAVANNGNEPIFVRQYTSGSTGPGPWPYGNTILRTLTLLGSSGETILPVSLTLNGSTSGSSTFAAPSTGSTLSYVLPGTAGAANTVLTNDGSGNLSWALPGGGGSTFGNVTVGVVTDNTISTTTGDLILDSATNNVNVTADLVVDGQVTINFNNNINIEGRYLIDSSALTTTTTAANQVLAFYGATTIRSAKFVVQIESGTDYQIVEILAIHNGTNGFVTSYGDVRTGANLASFDADVSGGNFRLLTTPVNAATTYKVAITAIDA